MRLGRFRKLTGGLVLALLVAVTGVHAQESPTPAEAMAAELNGGAPEGTSPAAARAPMFTGATAVERAWQAPAESLERRIELTRRAALSVGTWDLDPAARALIRGGAASAGTPIERARGAVDLAPHLPAAHLWLAKALWLHEESPMDAVRAVVGGLHAIPGHAEGSLWFAGSGLYLLAVALLGGGLILITLAGLLSAPHAAHDLSHLLPGKPPGFARYALLGALLLAPLAFGEGVLGVAGVLLAIGVAYGRGAHRVALGLAAAGVFCALYPLPRLAGAALEAFPSDTVARAAYSTAQGIASPVDLTRLEAASEEDPLALRALAIHARQTGSLGTADALYQRLLEEDPTDVALMNNAANVRLDLGHVSSALELYDLALEWEESAVVLFNLSQAYGRAFQVDDLNRALADAQRADGELIAHLASLQRTKNEDFVVDLPLPASLMWERVLASDGGHAVAAEFRAPFAPGRLGGTRDHAGAALLIAVAVGWLLGSRFSTSRWCTRCGDRQCARCGGKPDADLCESCTRLFYQPEKTDRTRRSERIEALRERESRMRRLTTVASILLPGAAGLLADRPMRAWLGSICFALVCAAVLWRGGVVPDPWVVGAAAPIAFLGSAAIAALVYFAIVATSLASAEAE